MSKTNIFFSLLKAELILGFPKGDAASRTAVLIYVLIGLVLGAILV